MPETREDVKPKKVSYVGAPAIFRLELACRQINEAFSGSKISFGHCYLVGSSLERPDWRDIDVRFVMGDDDFDTLFPDAHPNGSWEMDPRWLLMTASISAWLSQQTGLPVDFQFQPMTFANKWHKGQRNAIGMHLAKREESK